MEKYVYIKKSIAKHFVDFAEPLKAEEYTNLGETWQDYEDNKWVPLSENQVSFYEQHTDASPKEVWDMEIYVPVKTLEQAKQEKIWEINDYDHSDAVNSFSVNGKDMWIDAQTRQQLRISLDACKDVGRETVTKWFDGIEYTYPITQWYQMLAAVEVYASDALNVTESHKAAVNALETTEAVESYDYTIDYPTKLVF